MPSAYCAHVQRVRKLLHGAERVPREGPRRNPVASRSKILAVRFGFSILDNMMATTPRDAARRGILQARLIGLVPLVPSRANSLSCFACARTRSGICIRYLVNSSVRIRWSRDNHARLCHPGCPVLLCRSFCARRAQADDPGFESEEHK
jgi:hypothetical protein